MLTFLISLTRKSKIETRSGRAGAALASRQRPAAYKDAGYESDQKPCFFVHFFLFLDFIDKLTKSSISCVFREVI